MTSTLTKLFLVSGVIIGFTSCTGEKETLEIEKPEEYIIPLQPGKSITYRLDSTVFMQAGRVEEVHSYQEKHVVDAAFTDNLGRTSYRIYRFLRDVDGTQTWRSSGSYVITPEQNTIEVIENNMRVLALVGPIKEGQVWKGNRYLASEPYSYLHSFSNDDNMGNWDFEIQGIGETETYNNHEINNIITVNHAYELDNIPIVDPEVFSSNTVSFAKYAKGIGLVYQEHILWEYQPNPGAGNDPYYLGFGVKRSLLEHN